MIYSTGEMTLHTVREIFKCETNDVVICQDRSSPARPFYTLLALKDRETAKTLLSIFENNPRDVEKQPYIRCFSHGEQLCYLFPYHTERSLEAFAPGQMSTPVIRENICVNLVMECLSSPLPFPLLYLVINQKQIHIEKDNSIYFSCYFDLRELNAKRNEADCTLSCGVTLLSILQMKTRKNLKSFELLHKRIASRSYRQLTELYRDIKVTSLPAVKPKLFQRLRSFWTRNKDRIFRLALVLSIISVVLALIILLSFVIFGDFPLFRLFRSAIKQIGTEPINIK